MKFLIKYLLVLVLLSGCNSRSYTSYSWQDFLLEPVDISDLQTAILNQGYTKLSDKNEVESILKFIDFSENDVLVFSSTPTPSRLSISFSALLVRKDKLSEVVVLSRPSAKTRALLKRESLAMEADLERLRLKLGWEPDDSSVLDK